MSAQKIISDWKRKIFKPIYWLEGEEAFFIDEIVDFAEHHILSESEAGFNLSVFYGKDADWAAVLNACMRYPMFSEKQVVLLKEAQHLKEIEKFENYIEKPLASTIFVVAFKEKKLDGRSKMAKLVKKQEYFLSDKIKENKLAEWTSEMIASRGLDISQKALLLLTDHVGNDLSRMYNEIDKLTINLKDRKNITEDDIEKYIGISKEFNPFELQTAIAKRDLPKAIRIIQYFEANPKAAPIQLILPSLYSFFSKAAMIFGASSNDERTIASETGIAPFFLKDYLAAAKNYNYEGIEKILLLLHQYNLKSIGVGDTGTSSGNLLKELLMKINA